VLGGLYLRPIWLSYLQRSFYSVDLCVGFSNVVCVGTKIWNHTSKVIMVRWLVFFNAHFNGFLSIPWSKLNGSITVWHKSCWTCMDVYSKQIDSLPNQWFSGTGLIWGLFYRADFVKQAFWIFFIGLVRLLPAYFISHFYFADKLELPSATCIVWWWIQPWWCCWSPFSIFNKKLKKHNQVNYFCKAFNATNRSVHGVTYQNII